MYQKRYIEYLETVTLSLLLERHRKAESLCGNDSPVQSIEDTSVCFSPSNIEQLIKEERISRSGLYPKSV